MEHLNRLEFGGCLHLHTPHRPVTGTEWGNMVVIGARNGLEYWVPGLFVQQQGASQASYMSRVNREEHFLSHDRGSTRQTIFLSR